MGLFNSLKARREAAAKAKAEKHRTREFADAAMAMCALITVADGKIEQDEIRETATFMVNSPVLSSFDNKQLIDMFVQHVNNVAKNYNAGKQNALATMAKLSAQPDAARAVIEVGIAIGASDGDFDPQEKAAVREACGVLGLNANEFDL